MNGGIYEDELKQPQQHTYSSSSEDTSSEWDDDDSSIDINAKSPSHNKDENEFKLSCLDNGISEHDFFEKYTIENGKIGQGKFALIKKITRKSDNAVFALKMIQKKGKSVEDIAALQCEILVLQKCNHKNVIKLIGWCDTETHTYVIIELCDGGNVFEHVEQCKKLSEKSAIHVIKQVAAGLLHVHSLGFVHRDLKPENIMYLSKDVDSDIKIIDFGLAGDVNKGPCKTPCGTPHYAAPEVLSSMEYDQSADMWSLGVVLYILLSGFPPFFDESNNMKNLRWMIKKGQYSFPSPFWDDISESAKDLIQKLLVKDPNNRLNAKQVLEHEWIVNGMKESKDQNFGGQTVYVKQMIGYFDNILLFNLLNHDKDKAIEIFISSVCFICFVFFIICAVF